MILAQISDPHVELGPGDRGSVESLAAGVRAVLALRPEPDAVLVSGDLAEHAADDEYARVGELLAPLPMPVHVLPGNHDDRDALRAHFPPPGGAAAGVAGAPYRYVTDVAGVRLVLCDTTIPGRDDGRLDVDWVAAQLGDGPAIVAMHHPPVAVGMPALDAFGVAPADREALAELLARSPHVRRVVTGHFHRAASATLGGCAVVTCPAIHLAARLEIGGSAFALVREPPAFALHVRVGEEVVSHVLPVS